MRVHWLDAHYNTGRSEISQYDDVITRIAILTAATHVCESTFHKYMTEKDAHKALEKFIAKFDAQRDAARALRVSQQYISDIRKSRRYRNVPDSILKGLGLRRVSRIERLKKRRKATQGANGSV